LKPSQHDDQAGKFNEPVKEISMVLVTSNQPPEVLKPTDRSLDLPATTVSAERTPSLRRRFGAVLSMRTDEFDTATPKSFAQRIAVSRCIVDQSSRFALENTLGEQRLYE